MSERVVFLAHRRYHYHRFLGIETVGSTYTVIFKGRHRNEKLRAQAILLGLNDVYTLSIGKGVPGSNIIRPQNPRRA